MYGRFGSRAALLLSAFLAALPAPGQECTLAAGAALQSYANACFQRLQVDPADFARRFNCVDPSAARNLRVEVDAVVRQTCYETRDGACEFAKDLGELETTFPSCDYPAWLDDRCYGDSYVQVIRPTSNPHVKAALLCRHKTTFSGRFDDFDDVAMIVHNAENGETCWFQSPNGEGVRLDGQKVPGPVCDGADAFWLPPDETAGIQCIQCHDSGPWMNSPWMRRATEELGIAYDEEQSPYLNGTPPFDRWPVPLFVKYDGHLGSGASSCTSCHKIAAARPDFRTCDTWINRATGRADPALATRLSGTGRQEHSQYWMPEDGTRWTRAAWESLYDDHVKGLVDCCRAVGRGPTGLPPDCRAYCPDRTDGTCPADRWTTP